MLHLKLKSESGMVMLVAMIVTFLGSILVTTYMSFLIKESRHSIWQKERAQSIYLAEAGIQKGLYFLNNLDATDNPWTQYVDATQETLLVSEDEIPVYTGTDIDDKTDRYEEQYRISLHRRFVDEDGVTVTLPPRFFLVRSTGTIKRTIPIQHHVSAIVSRISGIPVPGALCIYDDEDLEDELFQFQSSQWVISGVDKDKPFQGVAGIAISNTGDNIAEDGGQLDLPGKPTRIDQVEGYDSAGNLVTGADAIFEDGEDILPDSLDEPFGYFRPMVTVDATGIGKLDGSYLGTPDNYQIVYADLSKGELILPGTRAGYGVLLLENDGTFQMNGNSEWYGLILCYGGANINMRGGGKTAAHIYGALMIDEGSVTTNGTADIRYSSDALGNIDKQLVAYQVFSWCGGWGKHLGRF